MAKKVLYINHSARVSGAEVSLISLLKNLDSEQYVPLVVLPEKGSLYDELKDSFRVEIVPIRRFKKVKNPILLFSYLINICCATWQISSLIRREKVKIIHSNSTNAHIFGALAGWINGVPSIWHVRDVVALGILGKILFSLSTRVIAISQFVKGGVLEYGGKKGEEKIATIYNGVELSALAEQESRGKEPGVREVYGLTPDIPLVAMIGQLVPWKRPGDFIKIAQKVLAEISQARFFMVGEDLFDDHPAYKVELKEMVNSLGIDNRVIFMGYLGYRHQIFRFLKGIDILVHPATLEPFGRVIIEAMALAKPVVAVRSGGPLEIVEDGWTGYLLPRGDIEGMASAVISLICNPDLGRQMGKRGRKRVEERFSLKQHADKIMGVYEHCH